MMGYYVEVDRNIINQYLDCISILLVALQKVD
jgi:hypothetical protein